MEQNYLANGDKGNPKARGDAQIGLRGLHNGIADMVTLPLEDQGAPDVLHHCPRGDGVHG
jgi:hypothetical protein